MRGRSVHDTLNQDPPHTTTHTYTIIYWSAERERLALVPSVCCSALPARSGFEAGQPAMQRKRLCGDLGRVD